MPRHSRRTQEGRPAQQQRIRVAQAAATLILEHGLTDWNYARRKAAHQLLLPENSGLPDDAEIEAALFEHQALFGGDTQIRALRTKREHALIWMERLSAFSPRLYGGLAEGWGGVHQPIKLQLIADDSKNVELALINAAIRYQATADASRESTVLIAEDAESEAHLRIDTPAGLQRRGKAQRRCLDRAALAALLEAPDQRPSSLSHAAAVNAK